MPSTTAATDPVSHYEVLSTFWAAACAARGTDLRGKHLINLDAFGSVPHGFIAELMSKLRPASVEYVLAKASSGKPFDIDLTDAYASVLTNEPCRNLVQEMPAAMGDLGMDSSQAPRPASPLGNGEFCGVLAEVPGITDFLSAGKHGQFLQSQVDANLSATTIIKLPKLYLDVKVPSSSSVPGETPALDTSLERPRQPKPVSALAKNNRVAPYVDRTPALEGNPAKTFSAAPSGPPLADISGKSELLANGIHGIRVQAQVARSATSELEQVKKCWPALVVPSSSFLSLSAKVPDRVNCSRLDIKRLAAAFDPVAIRQEHYCILTQYTPFASSIARCSAPEGS